MGPKFGNGKGMEKNTFPKFGNGKEMKKIHSHNSGMGIRGYHSQKYPGTGTGMKTLPKAQRTRGLSSYHKITVHSLQILNICITISESQISVNFKISTKHQHLY